jgi:hypothetical protein
MAIISSLRKVQKDRSTQVSTTSAGYGFIEIDGVGYFVLESYGSAERAIPDKTSQVFHIDREHAVALKIALEEAFPGI